MSKLNWIGDDDIKKTVQFLLNRAEEANSVAKKNFGKNVIDPFSALFTMSGFDLDFQTWLNAEVTRQSQKTLQNHIGKFHQDILGSVCDFEDLGTGNIVDLVSDKNKIIAEVKNKYNTISGGKLSDLYKSLERLVMPKSSKYKGFTAYYVAIIPKNKNRYDKPFTPS
ncbi:MAG TPA: Eco47II family restriction endonuclease, partial [Bacteroidetes bacterium]|nr:Eco47II family restriction endonuclease [Bacteroidota bacterium]